MNSAPLTATPLTPGKKWGAVTLLLITTFFWGVTFTIVKEAIDRVDVFVFLSQRFLAAFLILIPVCLVRKRHFSLRALKHGVLLGLFLFGSYAFQTLGLKFSTASNTGFLTGLNVVMVPVIGAFLYRQSIPRNVRWGVGFATPGLFLLCTNGTWMLNKGDPLTIVCAACVAMHLILTGEYTRTSDVTFLTTVQLGVVALLSIFVARFGSQPVFVWHPGIFWTLLICVLFATVFAFVVQTSMQRFIPPSQTALIFCMEPVFAAGYAYWAIHERLGLFGLLGAMFILTGMILSEISFTNRSSNKAGRF
jgi:drug/metabolite transporter (DMT)-like permease